MSIELILILIILLPVAALLSFTSPRLRGSFIEKVSLSTLIVVFALICYLYPHVRENVLYFRFPNIMGTGLYLKLDMLRYLLILLTSFSWIICYIYSTHYILNYKHKKRYFFFFMLTFPTTLGFFMSDNIINLFTFFEIMTVGSYFLVIQDEDKYTHKAGFIYILMSIAGGLVQLMGIFLLYNYTSTLTLSEIPMAMGNLGSMKYVISLSIIIGFGVKACMFPLHVWLPKVYSPTPSPATAIFSAILTKTGIFGIYLVLQMSNFDKNLSILIGASGLINMFLGGLLAMHHRNIKKAFAYSSMSQIGYILLAVSIIGLLGSHGESAYYAGIFHMTTHALTKIILFLGCGVAIFAVGDMSLNNIRGFGKNKPLYKFCFLIGLLGTAGIPGFSGFASKNMIHHAVTEATHMFSHNVALIIEIIFFISSAFTIVYCIKIYKALFIEKYNASSYEIDKSFAKFSLYPMLLVSILVIMLGLRPNLFLNFIGYNNASLHFYSPETLLSTLYIFITGFLIYFLYVERRLKVYIDVNNYYFVNPTHEWFDLERDFYLPFLYSLLNYVTVILSFLDNIIVDIAASISSFMRYIGSPQFQEDLNALYLSLKNRSLNRKIKRAYQTDSLTSFSASEGPKNNYLGQKSIDLNAILNNARSRNSLDKDDDVTLRKKIHLRHPDTLWSIIIYIAIQSLLLLFFFLFLF